MKKIVKHSLFLPSLILGLFVCYVIIFNGGILLFSGDSFEMMYQFYVGGYTKFYEGTLFSFDFSMGLGANPIYTSANFLFSPFFYLTLLFPKDLIAESFLWMTALKLFLIYIMVYKWTKKLYDYQVFNITASLLFTFSGWSFFYMHYVFFLDHLIVLPILLYFTECFLQNKQYKGLVLTMAYLTIANYYFAYLFIYLICMYALFRTLVLYGFEIKIIIKKAMGFIGSLLLGVLMGAVVLLPNIYAILNNPRLESAIDYSLMNKYELYKFFTSFLTPITSRLDANFFIEEGWYRFIGWGNGVNLYMGAFVILAMLCMVQLKNCREKLLLIGFYGLGIIFFIFPIFSMLFQATMDTRWFLYFNIFNVIMLSFIFKNKLSKKQILIATVLSICIVLFFTGVSYYFNLNTVEQLNDLMKIQLGVVTLLIVSGICLIYKYNWIIYVIVLDVLFSFIVFIHYNTLLDTTSFLPEYTNNETYELDDSDFYRISHDSYDYWPSNNAFAKNIPGVSFYSSLYNYEMEAYLARFKTTWSMPNRQGQDLAYNLLSVKYWVTKTYEHEPPYGYELSFEKDGLFFYENKYFTELGKVYTKTIHSDTILQLPYLTQDIIMQDYMVLDSSTNTAYESTIPLELVNSYQFENEISFYDSIWATGLVFENTNANDLDISLYYNGTLLKTYSYYGQSYIILPLHENYYVSDVVIKNKSSHLADINYYHLDMSFIAENYKTNETVFTDVKHKSNLIEANLDLSEKGYVYLSIPYDKGWTLSVNEETIDYEKANLGFIGFELEVGSYEIKLSYTIPYLKQGMILSIVGFMIFGVIILGERNLSKKKQRIEGLKNEK